MSPTRRPPRRQVIGPSSAPTRDSVIKILISTDNHLGYLEKDPVRGDDSFRAFEEVLQIAKANEVDMVLLGGDLFHDNKPSRSTLVKTMRLLRSMCMSPGGKVSLAVRSDPDLINYKRSTVAVTLPVFVIHGNHDDPTGATGLDALSALDILSEAGLVTYFGKVASSKRIELAPILLTKGRTALALYGMGNVRDEVLYHTWAKERNVKWLSPMENPAQREIQRHDADRVESNDIDSINDNGDGNNDIDDDDVDQQQQDDLRWFNLLVLHQNRVMRGTSKGISEALLPSWLDYVVWGHEHDSIPDLTLTTPPVVQPGSSVATSLSLGESKAKHAILLEVYRGKLKHRSIPLQTVRSFRFHDVALSEASESEEGSLLSETDPKTVSTFLEETVREMTTELEAEYDAKVSALQTGAFKTQHNGVKYPPSTYYLSKLTPLVRQPLIRLRVEISGNWDVPNPQRFGQGFLGRVASAADVLLFYRSRRRLLKKTRTAFAGYSANGSMLDNGNDRGRDNDDDEDGDMDDEGMMLSQNGAEQRDVVQIPKLVQYYLYHSKAGGTGLKFLELDRLTGAVDHFVNKNEAKAIGEYVSSYLKVQQDKTLDEVANDLQGLDESKLLEKFKECANEAAKRVLREGVEKNKKPGVTEQQQLGSSSGDGEKNPDDDDDDDDDAGRGFTSRDNGANRNNRNARNNDGNDDDDIMKDDDDDDNDDDENGDDTLGKQRNASKPGANSMADEDEIMALVDNPDNALDDVHAVLASVPKLAQQIEQIRPLADSDDNGDGDYEDDNNNKLVTKGRSGIKRGRGRLGGGTTTSRGGRSGAGARRATTSNRRNNSSIVIEDSDDNDDNDNDDNDNDDIQPVVTSNLASRRRRTAAAASNSRGGDDEHDEYVPVNTSARKRRARVAPPVAAPRASQRRRNTDSASASASAATPQRRSVFASRARTRRNTATIDVDEASGDDAM